MDTPTLGEIQGKRNKSNKRDESAGLPQVSSKAEARPFPSAQGRHGAPWSDAREAAPGGRDRRNGTRVPSGACAAPQHSLAWPVLCPEVTQGFRSPRGKGSAGKAELRAPGPSWTVPRSPGTGTSLVPVRRRDEEPAGVSGAGPGPGTPGWTPELLQAKAASPPLPTANSCSFYTRE